MGAIDTLFPRTRKKDKVNFRIIKENPGFRKFSEKRPPKKIAASISQYSSEVMVKVSGYTKSGAGATGKGAGPVSAHINYISRHGKTTLETDRGELISGKNGIKIFCADWQSSIDAARSSAKSRDVMHLVLSMPGQEDPEKMRAAIRAFAAATFGNRYEYAFVLHTDTENTHGHLAVKCRGFDGKQMQMAPGVAQEWRTAFAASLRAQGIHAEATPRSYRGVLQKSEPQAFRHMERPRPESGRKPRIPEVRKQQMRETLAELERIGAGETLAQNPLAEKARLRVREIQGIWLEVAKELEETDTRLKDRDGRPFSGESLKESGIYETPKGNGNDRGTEARASAVRQPASGASFARAAARANASLRDLPGWNLDDNHRHTQVLLSPDAPAQLEQRGRTAPDFGLRPADSFAPGAPGGTGAAGERSRGVGRTQELTLAEQNRRLAGQIREFVKNMPELKTKREVMREKMLGVGAEIVREQMASKSYQAMPDRESRDFER